MTFLSLRAPEEHGALLIQPPPQEWPNIVASNAQLFRRLSLRFCDIPLKHWRAATQRLARAWAGQQLARWGLRAIVPDAPCLVTGHQPELFHPGVWAKHFALAEACQSLGLAPVNLIADHDQPKTLSLRVPTQINHRLSVTWIPFCELRPGLAWEEYVLLTDDISANGNRSVGVHQESPNQDGWVRDSPCSATHLLTLSQRAETALADLLPDTILPQFVSQAGHFLNLHKPECRLADVLAGVRRHWEERWGYHNGELYVSTLCESEGFMAFTGEVLRQLPRFVTMHNMELMAFRKEEGLRSRTHPVPPLGQDGDWHEAPFWVWQDGQPRQRLWARCSPHSWTLRIGETGPCAEIRPVLDQEGLHEWKQALKTTGWKIRPRALTLTLFVRLFLAEMFIHGIGGGLYDRFTDRLLQRYWEVPAPQYAVVSATLRLPLPCPSKPTWVREQLLHRMRDCQYNPERVLPRELLSLPEVRRSVIRKQELLNRWSGANREQRRELHREFSEIREVLRPLTLDVERQLRSALQTLADYETQLRLVRDREWAFVLYSDQALTYLVERIRQEFGGLRHS
ncbi:MAG: hypothetical protein RMJ82_12180 [Gemmatales bacterium]|nr:hypothetical protein [Gemmatales bacterium]